MLVALVVPGVAAAATWESIGGGVVLSSEYVTELALDPAGGLVVGGAFEAVCVPPAHPPSCSQQPTSWGITRWTGSQWEAYGAGVAGDAPYPSIAAFSPAGTLYIGGSFNAWNSPPSDWNTYPRSIAAWNGSAWSPVGTAFQNSNAATTIVNAILFDRSGDMYVGGNFTTINAPGNFVAKWNGTTWSALGSGLDRTARALAMTPDGTLYAGGAEDIGGVCCVGLKTWNGTSWTPVAAGPNQYVFALATDRQGVLYAGGSFTTPVQGIIRWDGTSWSALGAGLSSNAVVNEIAIDADGNVYAAGTNLLSTSMSEQVAKWDGDQWSLVGGDFTGGTFGTAHVYSLLIDPAGYLYAGGSFFHVDGIATGQIVRTVIAVPPGAPTGVAATAGDTTAEVSWSEPAKNGAGTITGYTVTSEPDGKTCTWTSGPLRCTVTGLRRGVAYTFSVTARNMAGVGAAATVATTTTAEPAAATAAETSAPRIARLLPASGSAKGGTRVELRGNGLAGATRVTFGGVRARIVRQRSGRLFVITPSHAPGTVAVTVTVGGLRGTKMRAYRYVAPTSAALPAVTG